MFFEYPHFLKFSYSYVYFSQTHIDSFAQQQPHLDIQMKIVNQTLTKYLERHTEIYERDMQRIGEIFSKLQKVLQMDTTTPGKQRFFY